MLCVFNAKALKKDYLQILWVQLPQHDHFLDNNQKFKFDKSLEEVCRLHQNVSTLMLKKVWNPTTGSYFYKNHNVLELLVFVPIGNLSIILIQLSCQKGKVSRKKLRSLQRKTVLKVQKTVSTGRTLHTISYQVDISSGDRQTFQSLPSPSPAEQLF